MASTAAATTTTAPAANAQGGSGNVPAYASASLYVGDLASEVTEGMLFELFNQVGPVASIRVCRDAVTRRSLGYAYVNFHAVADADRALDTLNNTEIKGKLCRIMWSQRDPSARKSGSGNIFIKNLDKSIDHKTLFDTFSMFGNILSCKVVASMEGESKGYGFVHYDSEESAKKAIEKVNNMMLAGKKVYVAPFKPKNQRQDGDGSGPRFTNIYAKNLPDTIQTEADLKAFFAPYGEITSAWLPTEKVSKAAIAKAAAAKKAAAERKAAEAEGKTVPDVEEVAEEPKEGDNEMVERAKGFAFVNFAEPESAVRAIEALNGKGDGASPMYVGRAQKKDERDAEMRKKAEQLKMERISKYQGVNLYVKNLEDTVDDDKLRQEFAAHGTITSCRVMRDEKGVSRGFGFVCFSTPEEATRAVTEMNTKMIGTKPIYVALAQRKEVRRAQLEMQHQRRGAPKQGPMPGVPGGVAVPGMYAPGAPVFFAPPTGAPPAGQQQGFVYPQQMMPRRGAWNTAAAGPYPMSGYMMGGMPPQQQQQQARAQAQRTAQQQRPAGAQGTPQNVAATMQAMANAPLDPKRIAELPADQQKMVLGEKLYPLIAASQPKLAGKITGMLLDSYFSDEIIHLIETPDSLNDKIKEALLVLEQHAKQHGAKE